MLIQLVAFLEVQFTRHSTLAEQLVLSEAVEQQ
jgi:hypothetical protein